MKNYLSLLFLGGLSYILTLPECLCCHTVQGVKLWPRMTGYSWDGIGEDPNADILLCDNCGDEHVKDMEDMWKEYYNSRY